MEFFVEAVGILLSPISVIFLISGVAAGILVGAIPGLTSTIAIGLLIPFTFGLTKYDAFILLLGIYCGSMYGGAIPAVMMNLPGTPTAAVTAIDGYRMMRKGEGARALSISLIASVAGGLISCVFLIFLSLQLAPVATAFAAPEYFALCVFALVVVLSMTSSSVLKGFLATCAGLLVTAIGIDPVTPFPRYTFGVQELMIGVPEVPATIGLFCVAEAFRLIGPQDGALSPLQRLRLTYSGAMRDLVALWRTIIRSSVIGTGVGILPGTGAMVASLIAYGEEKRVSKKPETFGQGSPEGVAASEAANNAVTGGCLIPMMTLGIPGDTNTLMLLGAMLVHGLIPGPALFREEVTLVHVIFMTMILANLVILVLGVQCASLFARVTEIDKRYLVPAILVLSITGPAISEGHIYYFWITIVFGFIGYIMDRQGYPVIAFAMGIVLGPILERNLRAALMLPESTSEIFLMRPICAGLFAVAAAVLIYSIKKEIQTRRKTSDATVPDANLS
ncbi:tripartite tricarboxylate transporter permease [Microvirga massiliensis]|uniref:tripartite tricarboxylate transporter permease n=1 Tax=Microvirga massiliensis TaxID=1033741 RepID=UPI00062BAD7E|nr:tripartite tricarboxylate transporter permease [Microvirga massiliensis]